ncbi:hypothetical protein HG530_002310 [Fusarium avenaceum]|nr:hypothetical protein HG530_002310 [Fusarium avenaceum]
MPASRNLNVRVLLLDIQLTAEPSQELHPLHRRLEPHAPANTLYHRLGALREQLDDRFRRHGLAFVDHVLQIQPVLHLHH